MPRRRYQVIEPAELGLDDEVVSTPTTVRPVLPDKRAVGERLKEAREKAGLLQRELSAKSGVDDGVISAAECGDRWPRTAAMLALADAMNVSLDWLFYGRSCTCQRTGTAE